MPLHNGVQKSQIGLWTLRDFYTSSPYCTSCREQAALDKRWLCNVYHLQCKQGREKVTFLKDVVPAWKELPMSPFSRPWKKLWQNSAATPSSSYIDETLSSQGTAPVSHPFLLPACPTIQQLALPERQAEARRCVSLLGVEPTPDQWQMILAPTSTTCVIAGAGSGKSTTLILRLLVLHKLLNIPLDEMHVFSFTRASTRDFQEKLAQRLACWEERVEQRSVSEERRAELRTSAQRVVSTFHSVIARLRSAVLMGEVAGFFDLLGERAATEEDMQHFNPFLTAKLSAQQREILNAAHTRAYDQSPEYRAFVTTLLTEETRQHWMRATSGQCLRAETEPAIWEAFLRQERAYHGFNRSGQFAPDPGFQDQRQCWYSDPYRAAVADRLRELGIPFVPLPSFPVRCPMNGGYGGQMYAAFQIGKLLLHIERDPHTTGEAAGRKLSFHERDRRKFIALYTDHFDQHKKLGPKDFVMADGRPRLSPDGERLLHGWVGFQEHASTSAAAPSVRVKVAGGLHRLHLAELLYQEGVFSESLRLEVEQVQVQGTLDLTSSMIAQMLPLFWRSFHAELTQRRYVRFHDVLSVLRQETTLRAMRGQLRHLKHLFIDEFQDVSAEMVDWLAKTLTVHVQDGGEEVSMICIGDDYQSFSVIETC